ncbi:PKD domain-containing protein [Nocardioides sp. KIGAM211]|uniref:PKD domain-containing protein n=1 Tax=Nocardioides luti TaxID=2761101 RepID=A0A7X0RJD2_9ACTN|nr:PKD domain-containing protein [Nocardioides luti]MBB6629409.1 PKD domain-containing protein [Nocardioides luti]
MSLRTALLLPVATAALVASGAAPALAGPSWTPSEPLADLTPDRVGPPVLDVNAAGDAVLAAVQSSFVGPSRVVAFARGAGGTWHPAALQPDGSRNVGGPHVAVDGSGRSIVAWVASDGSRASSPYVEYTLFARGAEADVTGGRPQLHEIATRDGATVSGLEVAVGMSGDLAAVWYDEAHDEVQAATGTITHGFSAPFPLAVASGRVLTTQVGVDAVGDAVFAWEVSAGDRHTVLATTLPQGEAPGPTVVLDGDQPGAAATGPSLSVTPDGQTLLAWDQHRYDDPHEVRYAVRTHSLSSSFASGTWSEVGRVSREGEGTNGAAPTAVLTPQDLAVVTYGDDAQHLVAASRPDGGEFGGHEQLSAAGQEVYGPASLDAGYRGALAVSFRAYDAEGSSTTVSAWRGATDTAFGHAVEEPVGGGSSIGVDGEGNAYLAGTVSECLDQKCYDHASSIAARIFDPVAPTLRGVSTVVRRAGRASTFTAMGVADRISEPTVTWTFGDGTAAVTGESVRHRFRKPGTYRVRTVVEDAAGNRTRHVTKVHVRRR